MQNFWFFLYTLDGFFPAQPRGSYLIIVATCIDGAFPALANVGFYAQFTAGG